jgi:hypothetical protein
MVKYLYFKESIKKCYVILQQMRKFSMEINICPSKKNTPFNCNRVRVFYSAKSTHLHFAVNILFSKGNSNIIIFSILLLVYY